MNDDLSRYAPVVAELIGKATGAPVEVVGTSGTTRPPEMLPAVRLRVVSVDHGWHSSRIDGAAVIAEVAVYSNDEHSLMFDPSAHTTGGAYAHVRAGLRHLQNGDVLTLERDGNVRRSTLADGTTATLHRLILRGVWETVPRIDLPGSGVHGLGQRVAGVATRSTSTSADARFGGRRGTSASGTAKVTDLDDKVGIATAEVTVTCWPLNGGDSGDVVRALDAIPGELVGVVVPGMGRCLSVEAVRGEPVYNGRTAAGIERVLCTRFTYRATRRTETV